MIVLNPKLLPSSAEFPPKESLYFEDIEGIRTATLYAFMPKNKGYLACITAEFPNPADDGESTMIEGVILTLGDAEHLPRKWNNEYQYGFFITTTFSTLKEGATISSSFYADEIVSVDAGLEECFPILTKGIPAITNSSDC